MGRKDKKKLKLNKETIRNLKDAPIDLLEGVHGGYYIGYGFTRDCFNTDCNYTWKTRGCTPPP